MVSLLLFSLALYSPGLVLGFPFLAEHSSNLDARHTEELSTKIKLLNLPVERQSLGGGLLNNVLQPLSGLLAGIEGMYILKFSWF